MKLLRHGAPGAELPGLVHSDGSIRDLSAHIDDIDGNSITPQALQQLAAIDPDTLPLVPEGARLGACLGNVGKFVCIGLNYADHARESNMPIPEEPVIFNKWTSAICGPDDDVIKPRGATKMDWEVELGVIIGSECRYVSEAQAEDCIAGYAVVNDVSERAFQLEGSGQWDRGKGCDTFGPLGPWMVTADEIADVKALDIWLEINGKRVQDGNTKTMIFSPAFIVSYLSQYMSLQPGDVISTGTPPGVGMGMSPPTFLQVGDEMHLGISGLGEQRQRVVAVD